MMTRWSGEVQVKVKSQKFHELDIGGRETFLNLTRRSILCSDSMTESVLL